MDEDTSIVILCAALTVACIVLFRFGLGPIESLIAICAAAFFGFIAIGVSIIKWFS